MKGVEGGGGVCIEYKQGTVENWLPVAANECVCACVCVCVYLYSSRAHLRSTNLV